MCAVFDESTAAKPTCGGEVSHRGGKGLDRRSIGARRAAEARVAIDFRDTNSDSSAGLAPGVYRLWCRLCQLHILVLASTDDEVRLGRRLQSARLGCLLVVPNLAGLIAVIIVSRHSDRTLGTPVSYGGGGSVGRNWFALAGRVPDAVSFSGPFFGRGDRKLQLLADFLFGARRIPVWFPGGCGYCACDLRRQPGWVRWTIRRRLNSGKDGQPVRRLGGRRSFIPRVCAFCPCSCRGGASQPQRRS